MRHLASQDDLWRPLFETEFPAAPAVYASQAQRRGYKWAFGACWRDRQQREEAARRQRRCAGAWGCCSWLLGLCASPGRTGGRGSLFRGAARGGWALACKLANMLQAAGFLVGAAARQEEQRHVTDCPCAALQVYASHTQHGAPPAVLPAAGALWRARHHGGRLRPPAAALPGRGPGDVPRRWGRPWGPDVWRQQATGWPRRRWTPFLLRGVAKGCEVEMLSALSLPGQPSSWFTSNCSSAACGCMCCLPTCCSLLAMLERCMWMHVLLTMACLTSK